MKQRKKSHILYCVITSDRGTVEVTPVIINEVDDLDEQIGEQVIIYNDSNWQLMDKKQLIKFKKQVDKILSGGKK